MTEVSDAVSAESLNYFVYEELKKFQSKADIFLINR